MHWLKRIFYESSSQVEAFKFCRFVFVQQHSDWSKLVEFSGGTERGATAWNTAQVSVTPAGKNDHSLYIVLSLQRKPLR